MGSGGEVTSQQSRGLIIKKEKKLDCFNRGLADSRSENIGEYEHVIYATFKLLTANGK